MRHPATTNFDEPDLTGPAGDAWMIDLPLERKTPDGQATLAGWLATIPGAHPFWHSYTVNLIHLRPIEGVKPAKKDYPEATHEVIILALDPDKPLCNPKAPDFRISHLMPMNLSLQFHGVSDGQAQGLARALVAEFVAGRISPDTDFRSLQTAFVREYLNRFGGRMK